MWQMAVMMGTYYAMDRMSKMKGEKKMESEHNYIRHKQHLNNKWHQEVCKRGLDVIFNFRRSRGVDCQHCLCGWSRI